MTWHTKQAKDLKRHPHQSREGGMRSSRCHMSLWSWKLEQQWAATTHLPQRPRSHTQCYQIHRGPAGESSVVTSWDVTWFSHCGGQKHEDIPIIGSGKHVPCCCPNDLDNLGPCRNLPMDVIVGGSGLALAWPHVCLAPSRWCCWEVVETLEGEASCRMQATWNTCWKAILSWPLPLSASCLPWGEWLSSTKPFHHGSLALIQAKDQQRQLTMDLKL